MDISLTIHNPVTKTWNGAYVCVVIFIIKLTSPEASGFPAILNVIKVRSQLTIK